MVDTNWIKTYNVVTDYVIKGVVLMASGSRTRTSITHLECPKCSNVVSLHRKKHKLKSKNHIKHMWCVFCKEITGHVEVKEEAFFPDWLRENEG